MNPNDRPVAYSRPETNPEFVSRVFDKTGVLFIHNGLVESLDNSVWDGYKMQRRIVWVDK